jgi:hypothetical protein
MIWTATTSEGERRGVSPMCLGDGNRVLPLPAHVGLTPRRSPRPVYLSQFCGSSAGLPLVEVIGTIGGLPGTVVIVVGIVVALMPEVIAGLMVVVVGVPHWPLAHGLAEVDFDPQQVLHPTAPKSTRLATLAACRIFFI